MMYSEVDRAPNLPQSLVVPYRELCRQYAIDNDIALIDVANAHSEVVSLWNQYPDGVDGASTSGGGKQLYWWTPLGTGGATPGRFDGVHPGTLGANEVAKAVIREIKASSDIRLKPLSELIDGETDYSIGTPLAVYPW